MKVSGKILSFFLILSCVSIYARADGFVATEVGPNDIVVSGKSDGIKVGDTLYHSVSPFRFTVREIKGDRVSLQMPNSHSVKVGDPFLRAPTEGIQKALSTQQKLKQALED